MPETHHIYFGEQQGCLSMRNTKIKQNSIEYQLRLMFCLTNIVSPHAFLLLNLLSRAHCVQSYMNS